MDNKIDIKKYEHVCYQAEQGSFVPMELFAMEVGIKYTKKLDEVLKNPYNANVLYNFLDFLGQEVNFSILKTSIRLHSNQDRYYPKIPDTILSRICKIMIGNYKVEKTEEILIMHGYYKFCVDSQTYQRYIAAFKKRENYSTLERIVSVKGIDNKEFIDNSNDDGIPIELDEKDFVG